MALKRIVDFSIGIEQTARFVFINRLEDELRSRGFLLPKATYLDLMLKKVQIKSDREPSGTRGESDEPAVSSEAMADQGIVGQDATDRDLMGSDPKAIINEILKRLQKAGTIPPKATWVISNLLRAEE